MNNPEKVKKTILLSRETNSMLKSIAFAMGERNHSTIINQLIRDEFVRRGMHLGSE